MGIPRLRQPTVTAQHRRVRTPGPWHLTPVGPLDAKDAALLQTPKIKAMLSDEAASESTG
jgi:hypothetical protein